MFFSLRFLSLLFFVLKWQALAASVTSQTRPIPSPLSPLDSAHGVYSGSQTPTVFPWNTYNYCNAPHVNAAHYTLPPTKDVELVYMNVMIRHHKRTPDNLYPDENSLNPPAGWDCKDFLQFNFGSLASNTAENAQTYHETNIPSNHPFLSQIWNGTCDEGQLTAAGLEDSMQHGKDFASVYINKLKFLKGVDAIDVYVRTSTEDRTYQVAGALLYGMDETLSKKQFKIDSLVPSYSCPNADNIRDQYQSVPAWTDHLVQNQELQTRLSTLTGVLGMSAWSSWYDHFFDTFTSRTCHGHPLPCNATGACVSSADAVKVFGIGDFEYNYIWKAAQNASTYNSLTFGVMFQELADNFKSFKEGHETFKLRFYVGHDGSMIRLASGLNIQGPLRWPALGSEFVWRTQNQAYFVRVMHEGTPAVGLEWVSLDDFISLLESNAPEDIFEQCLGSS
ncbi:hypothetical protein Clacol_002757 [Clathrus columnatus]|uniref:Phosphoglycerate mutase-like protein n=1 Tax=Clathrus columnatus TaxID=1419009 RepID=A0AAV5A5L4_9AGAM|nr:hypothetical protein Clacol_002757 [Clathrus columnatus]